MKNIKAMPLTHPDYPNWWEEKRSAYLYAIMAKYESNLMHKKLFLDLQTAAQKQAHLWAKKMQTDSLLFQPDCRTRFIAYLVRCFGTRRIHYILSAMKIRGMSIFTHYHHEHKHTTLSAANNLRAAIFGINDGLISNMSLLLGLVGGAADQHIILLAGMAGLLAGACSMGAGEYISVRSQREIFERQIAIEKQELAEYPEEEQAELSLIYQARGIPKVTADHLATLLIDNPEIGLNVLVREELGINPEDLVSPVGAMLSSFLSFAVGATIPLLPFLFGNHPKQIIISLIASTGTLFMIGTILSLFTNRHPLLSGLRMLLIGISAGGLTYFMGRWLGLTL